MCQSFSTGKNTVIEPRVLQENSRDTHDTMNLRSRPKPPVTIEEEEDEDCPSVPVNDSVTITSCNKRKRRNSHCAQTNEKAGKVLRPRLAKKPKKLSSDLGYVPHQIPISHLLLMAIGPQVSHTKESSFARLVPMWRMLSLVCWCTGATPQCLVRQLSFSHILLHGGFRCYYGRIRTDPRPCER